MRFKTSNLREPSHTDLVSCVGWSSADDVYSVADDHQVAQHLLLLILLLLLLLVLFLLLLQLLLLLLLLLLRSCAGTLCLGRHTK